MFSVSHTGPVSFHAEGEDIWTKGILLNIWEAQLVTDIGCRLCSGLAWFNALSHIDLGSLPLPELLANFVSQLGDAIKSQPPGGCGDGSEVNGAHCFHTRPRSRPQFPHKTAHHCPRDQTPSPGLPGHQVPMWCTGHTYIQATHSYTSNIPKKLNSPSLSMLRNPKEHCIWVEFQCVSTWASN